MRGSTRYEALQAYHELLNSSLACVVVSPQIRAGNIDGEPPFALTLNNGRSVPLIAAVLPVALRLRQWFWFIENPTAARSGRWRISITSYDYVLLNPVNGAELLALHWHPEQRDGGPQLVTFPHLHIGSSVLSEPVLAKMHIPTERIAVEDVVALVIQDFQARPLVRNWERRLRVNRTAFERSRTWPRSGTS